MTPETSPAADKCQRAVAALKKCRPSSYEPLLEFYGQMFSLQEEALLRVEIPLIELSKELLQVKIRSHFPLISLQDFPIDLKESEALFVKLCQLSMTAQDGLKVAAERLKAAIDQGRVPVAEVLEGLLAENEVLGETAEKLGVEAQSLAFIAYHSIRPSIVKSAVRMATHLEAYADWQKGYCPVCGSSAGLSVLDGEGKREMACSFCWHRWPVNRACCPSCGDRAGQQGLAYFYSDEEKEYRVETCAACKLYFKTIDMREMGRPLYLPLEQLATLHLDVKAQELGFSSLLQINMGA